MSLVYYIFWHSVFCSLRRTSKQTGIKHNARLAWQRRGGHKVRFINHVPVRCILCKRRPLAPSIHSISKLKAPMEKWTKSTFLSCHCKWSVCPMEKWTKKSSSDMLPDDLAQRWGDFGETAERVAVSSRGTRFWTWSDTVKDGCWERWWRQRWLDKWTRWIETD